MKLKVGGFYRVAWEGEPRWAVITRIEVFGPGTVKIHYAFAPPLGAAVDVELFHLGAAA